MMLVYLFWCMCGVFDFVVENMKNNVGFVKMIVDGLEFVDVYLFGYLFFVFKIGVEVMWNVKVYYCGVGVEMCDIIIVVFLCKGVFDWIKNVFDVWIY